MLVLKESVKTVTLISKTKKIQNKSLECQMSL